MLLHIGGVFCPDPGHSHCLDEYLPTHPSSASHGTLDPHKLRHHDNLELARQWAPGSAVVAIFEGCGGNEPARRKSCDEKEATVATNTPQGDISLTGVTCEAREGQLAG